MVVASMVEVIFEVGVGVELPKPLAGLVPRLWEWRKISGVSDDHPTSPNPVGPRICKV
jgi:hypothetical protein